MSSASLIEGDLAVFENFQTGRFICRLESAAPTRSESTQRLIREKIKEKQSAFDDDW
jgi:hypothetical protein